MGGVNFTKSWTEPSCKKQYEWQRFKGQYPSLRRFLFDSLVGSYLNHKLLWRLWAADQTQALHVGDNIWCKMQIPQAFFFLFQGVTNNLARQWSVSSWDTCNDHLLRNNYFNDGRIAKKWPVKCGFDLKQEYIWQNVELSSLMSQLFGLVYRIQFFFITPLGWATAIYR